MVQKNLFVKEDSRINDHEFNKYAKFQIIERFEKYLKIKPIIEKKLKK